MTRLLPRFLLLLSVVLGTALGAPSASAAPGNAACSVLGQHGATASDFDLFCNGAPGLAGLWKLRLADGIASGVAPGGGTVKGTYTQTPCTVYVSVTVNQCYTISATVCVNGNCTTVTIVVCVSVSASACVRVYTHSEGTATILSA